MRGLGTLGRDIHTKMDSKDDRGWKEITTYRCIWQTVDKDLEHGDDGGDRFVINLERLQVSTK